MIRLNVVHLLPGGGGSANGIGTRSGRDLLEPRDPSRGHLVLDFMVRPLVYGVVIENMMFSVFYAFLSFELDIEILFKPRV